MTIGEDGTLCHLYLFALILFFFYVASRTIYVKFFVKKIASFFSELTLNYHVKFWQKKGVQISISFQNFVRELYLPISFGSNFEK
jgi:hypothetical protein